LARDTPLNAAYIGASNGDRPEFYGIFEAAVDAIGITDRRMIDYTSASSLLSRRVCDRYRRPCWMRYKINPSYI
jgi:hypothetical protein